MNPQLAGQIRHILTFVSGLLAAHGFAQASAIVNLPDVAEIVGGIIGVIMTSIFSIKAASPAALQQKAADTLPVGTVLPATTEAVPKAVVMTPESATEFIRNPVKSFNARSEVDKK